MTIISAQVESELIKLDPEERDEFLADLGADEGGSGVALDAAKYRESVAYWAGHAPIQ